MIVEILKAFFVGGIICSIGQLLIDYTKLTPARILTGFVVAGVILSGLGLYKPLLEFAGAGASVPLTGFGHLLAEGIRKSIGEKGILGIFTGGLTAASGGVTAAIIFGVIAAVIFKQKDKS
ncbi:MAG: stage V sporulation protein AE [Ruminococcus sp.]|nr:stage V sporulation protein AE [Ruminococcus sp.]